MAFRRPKNLKDYLVHARVKPDNNYIALYKAFISVYLHGAKFVEREAFLTLGIRFSHTTRKSYSINYNLDCNSSNVIYI